MPGPRSCDQCGTTYQPKRSTSQFCSDLCRKRHGRASVAPAEGPLIEGAVTEATRRDLVAADLLESVLGQTALVLARHIDSITPARAGSLAPLCKVHREVLAEVRKRTPLADDPMMGSIRERVRAKRSPA